MLKRAVLLIIIAFIIMVLPSVSANPVDPFSNHQDLLIFIFGVPLYLVMSMLSVVFTVSILYSLLKKYKLARKQSLYVD